MADVSDFTRQFEFTNRMLEKAGVAATPGIDFDPIHGRASSLLLRALGRRVARGGGADRALARRVSR